MQPRYTLIQYHFKGKEHEVVNLQSHGNAKQSKAYRRVMASTRKTLHAFLESKDTAKIALDKVYRSLGDVTGARSIGQFPRGPQGVYNARCAAKKESVAQGFQT